MSSCLPVIFLASKILFDHIIFSQRVNSGDLAFRARRGAPWVRKFQVLSMHPRHFGSNKIVRTYLVRPFKLMDVKCLTY